VKKQAPPAAGCDYSPAREALSRAWIAAEDASLFRPTVSSRSPMNKSFLVLFSKKNTLLPCLKKAIRATQRPLAPR
jgi:hypothetical protein